ncbi:hypothetical protein NDU88_003305, partial [Pleurodeles waltl]
LLHLHLGFSGLLPIPPPGHFRDSWTWSHSFTSPQVQEYAFSVLVGIVVLAESPITTILSFWGRRVTLLLLFRVLG